MQTKLYTIQLSHHLRTDLESVSEQQSQNLEITNFTEFPKMLELLGKRGFELTEMRKAD